MDELDEAEPVNQNKQSNFVYSSAEKSILSYDITSSFTVSGQLSISEPEGIQKTEESQSSSTSSLESESQISREFLIESSRELESKSRLVWVGGVEPEKETDTPEIPFTSPVGHSAQYSS